MTGAVNNISTIVGIVIVLAVLAALTFWMKKTRGGTRPPNV